MRKDGRRSDEVMPMREAPIGHGNGGPMETEVGEDRVLDNRPLSSRQPDPAVGGSTGPSKDTRELGSATADDQSAQDHVRQKRTPVRRELKPGGRTTTGYAGYFRPTTDRERN